MTGNKKRIGALLLALTVLAAGCGGQGKQDGEDPAAGSTAAGMGRYMESVFELPEDMNRNGGLNWLSDGDLTAISFGEGLYRSEDEGRTWKKEETDWFPLLQNVYCLAAVMGPDETVAASCSGGMPQAVRDIIKEPVEEDWEGNYCVFGMPDGEIKVVDFGFSQEDGSCIQSFVFKEDGRLFAGDMQGKIYEVDIEKESLKELFEAEQAAGYVGFSGEILMAAGADRLYLYDLEQEVLLSQDQTVDGFISQMLPDGTVSYTGGGFPLAVTGSEEEGVIYIACKAGMYRHVLGGSTMEQVIDGGLSAFGDAYSSIYHVKTLPGQEFMVEFGPSTGLMRYTFDETVASMPDKEIRIYSLEENAAARQAVTAYKRGHTDIYVRYEVGLEHDSGMTKEDALKRLNTQVLAGEGPDVLILDGLPMDTYKEKGMLKNIAPLLKGLGGEDELFSNVVEGCTDEGGAVYAMPMCVKVPLLAGSQDVISGMDDLEQIADTAERLREEQPSGGILGIYDAETMLQLFGMVSAPAWTDGSGQMDVRAVETFFTLVDRIYRAELAGAVPAQQERLAKEAEEMEEYGTDPVARRMEACNNVLYIPQKYARIACGYADGIQLCLDTVTSAVNEDETLDYRIFNGQKKNLFLPSSLVGISAGSPRTEDAENFVRTMFGADVQSRVYDGYPVNKAAYQAHFDAMEENGENGSMILTMDDGTEKEFTLYWPDAAQRQKFTAYVEALKEPALTDEYLCGLVYEAGVKVLEDGVSAEDAAAETVKKASLYLAE